MRRQGSNWNLILIVGFVLLGLSASGAVRISFLADTNALADTVALVRSNGCSEENCAAFARAVEHYFSTPFDLDLSKCPASTRGFYSFASVSNLMSAVPCPLDEARHPWELNCFDTVILLAGGLLHMNQGPDEKRGTFLAPSRRDLTNSVYDIRPEATPRAAFLASYPDWAREVTDQALPSASRDARVCLAAALYRFFRLPEAVTEGALRSAVLAGLRDAWKEEGMTFPQQFEVVLCHEATLPQPFFYTVHTGLLYPRTGGGYTYIEKAGGLGPFVRLDLDSKDSLLIWLAGAFRGVGQPESPRRFVTFNDREIRPLEIVK